MTFFDVTSRCCSVAALGVLLAVPAQAEENRLLPFWGQPYPSGYAWTAAQALGSRRLVPEPGKCGPIRTREYGRRGRPVRCEAVLHARD